MDGENTTLYRNGLHARSLDSVSHPLSQSWLKNFHACIQYNIPEEYRICGENLYARHSIAYNTLPTYFMAFSIWKNDLCLSWEDTKLFSNIFQVHLVPVLYTGIYNKELEIQLQNSLFVDEQKEGYVIRLADSFLYEDFAVSVAKYVRKNHVPINTKHWKTQKIIPNKLI